MVDNGKQVLDAMKKAGKPLKAGEIGDMTGMDKKDVTKTMDALKKDGKIISPMRCFWEPAK